MEEKKDWRQHRQELAVQKVRKEELLQQGWQSTGDLPYTINDSLRERGVPMVLPVSLASRIGYFLELALQGTAEEYRENNMEKFGKKVTFISPDLAKRIEEAVKKHYESLGE